jgi:hypothetical protein
MIDPVLVAQSGSATLPLGDAQHMGPAPTLAEIGGFEAAMQKASSSAGGLQDVAEGMRGVVRALETIDGAADRLAERAKKVSEGNMTLQPGELVMLTVKSHEFLFHSQLVSNIANRTSDGLQQLFRQQM